MLENRRALGGVAGAVVIVCILVAWRRRRAATAPSSSIAPAATASSPGLPTPTSIPDASDGFSRAYRFITGAPTPQYAPTPATLTPDQLARLRGSVGDTVVVKPATAQPMPGSIANTPSALSTAGQAAGTVSGLLTGVFG